MSYRNRYVFIKRTYPKNIVLFLKKGKYISYGLDKEFLKYLRFKKINDLNYWHINYLILENMQILEHLPIIHMIFVIINFECWFY